MIDIIVIILTIILCILLYFGMYRNSLAIDFAKYLNHKGYEVCVAYLSTIPDEEYTKEKDDEFERLRAIWHSIHKISYFKMVFSFKPLKEKYWLTKEQIEFLHLYD